MIQKPNSSPLKVEAHHLLIWNGKAS